MERLIPEDQLVKVAPAGLAIRYDGKAPICGANEPLASGLNAAGAVRENGKGRWSLHRGVVGI